MSTHPELGERDRRILGVLVRGYIDDGEPVSSLWLASQGFGVSSATLRNILARLEEYGYVRQPHTSAGRVPTDRGYRTYVDQLLSERRSSRAAPQVEARLRRGDRRDSIETAFWALMHNVFPDETRKHMKAAGREQLMAARSYLDHWIAKLEEKDGARLTERETIEVE